MAYNFIGECSAINCWKGLNERVRPFRLIEYVPMSGIGLCGGIIDSYVKHRSCCL